MDYVKIAIVPPPSGPLCDFCSSPAVVASHNCETFVDKSDPKWVQVACGNWAACAECDRLIRREDRSGLLERSVRKLMKKHRLGREAYPFIRADVKKTHDQFWNHRRMEA